MEIGRNDNSSQNFSFYDDIETPYHPPNTFSFPKTTFGKKDRSSQASWFVKFPWLHYDERYIHFGIQIWFRLNVFLKAFSA